MNLILLRLKELLTDAGWKVHVGEVQQSVLTPDDYPYVVVTGRAHDYSQITFGCKDLDTWLRFTIADTTPLNCLDSAERFASLVETFDVSTARWHTHKLRVEPVTDVAVDRSIKISGSNTYPAFTVMEARLLAEEVKK